MRKFNPSHWKGVSPNETFESPKGLLQLRLSREAEIFITDKDGVETFAACSSDFRLASEAVTHFRVAAPDDTQILLYSPDPVNVQPSGETFTSVDMMPIESAHVREIRRAGRLQELRLRQERKAMQQAFRDMQALNTSRRTEAELSAAPVAPDPEPEAQTEA